MSVCVYIFHCSLSSAIHVNVCLDLSLRLVFSITCQNDSFLACLVWKGKLRILMLLQVGHWFGIKLSLLLPENDIMFFNLCEELFTFSLWHLFHNFVICQESLLDQIESMENQGMTLQEKMQEMERTLRGKIVTLEVGFKTVHSYSASTIVL